MDELTVAAALRNYRYYKNVCAVSFGTKFMDGMAVPGVTAVQFFVTEKVGAEQLRRALPQFVYARQDGGRIDPSSRIPTDVIELRNLELCCASGDPVSVVGAGDGATTLLFQNKVGSRDFLAVTCSHVVGNMSATPTTGELRGGPSSGTCLYRANVLFNTVLDKGKLEFDVAVAKLLDGSGATDLGVAGSTNLCDGFAGLAEIAAGAALVPKFPVTANETATFPESALMEVREIDAGNVGKITVGNLYACKAKAVKGDSGGPLYVGNKIAGILVAKAADDWILIHLLKDALDYLGAREGFEIRCF